MTFYLFNVSRSIFTGDSGLLVTVSSIGGVAHPPGYPLFTLIGFVFTRVSSLFHVTDAFAVGSISAIASSLALVIYFRLALQFTKSTLIAVVTTLILGTTYLFWLFALVPEVFALNNLFALLLIYLSLQYVKKKTLVYLLFLSFVAGLSLTNQFTIILLFPALFLIVSPQLKKDFLAKRKIVFYCLAAVLIGLLPYLYVVIASLHHPAIDWAQIKDVRSFIEFVLRMRYGTFKAGYFETQGINDRWSALFSYATTFTSYVTIPVVILCLLGMVKEVFTRKRYAIGLLSGFILAGPVFFFYAAFPFDTAFYVTVAERFITLSIIIALLFLPLGIAAFSQKIADIFSRPIYSVIFSSIFLLIPLQLFIANYPRLQLANISVGNELGRNYLESLPQNSVLLLASDTSLFSTWYMHYVQGIRPDVTILNAVDPKQINASLHEKNISILTPDNLFDAQTAVLKNIEIIDASYPVFSEVPFAGNKRVTWLPHGLAYELRRSTEPKLSLDQFRALTTKIWDNYQLTKNTALPTSARNTSYESIYNAYAWALWHTGVYFSQTYKDPPDYGAYMLRSIQVDPNFALGYASLGSYFLSYQNNCKLALLDFNIAVEKDSLNKKFYQQLVNAQLQCHTDKRAIESVKKLYKEKFHSELTLK